MKVKRIAVLAASLAFAVSVFCLPAAASTTQTYSLVGHTFDGAIYNGVDDAVALANWTIGKPNGAGNVFPPLSNDAVDRFDLSVNFDTVMLDSSSDYTLSWYVGFYNSGSLSIRSASVSLYNGSDLLVTKDISFQESGYYLVSNILLTSVDLASVSQFDSIRVVAFPPGSVSGFTNVHFRATFSLTRTTQADIIGDKIDEQTDAFIEGDGTPLAPDYNEDLNNSADELTDLENEALGGKSDEEIAAEVDEALDFDMSSLDSNASSAMAGLFDDMLDVFGTDYQALLLLALSLGLAAFIIGRRYKA